MWGFFLPAWPMKSWRNCLDLKCSNMPLYSGCVPSSLNWSFTLERNCPSYMALVYSNILSLMSFLLRFFFSSTLPKWAALVASRCSPFPAIKLTPNNFFLMISKSCIFLFKTCYFVRCWNRCFSQQKMVSYPLWHRYYLHPVITSELFD